MQATFSVKVAAKNLEASDICSFELTARDGQVLPTFEAGAHIDVFLPSQPARQYSLCNDPTETHRYVIGVLRAEDSRGVSRALHDDIEAGMLLDISSPKNHFGLVPAAGRTLLLAGGIGVTPILSMAEALCRQGANFELHYACRTRARAAFLDRIAAAPYAGRTHFWFDDEHGKPLDLPELLTHPSADDHVYICGPTGLLEAARKAAHEAGWNPDHVHYEYFSGGVLQTESDTEFELEVAETGQVVTVAKSQSALDALLECGIDIPCSCEEGVCGMCLTAVRSGTPDHRDKFLTDAERARNDSFMPCCSRAKSGRLVISLEDR
ncbi:MAG TPA: PDR/VanB family oxidoreductase [Ramlibacter sp.]|nr:PDR/VanB family oxidoreductase [Ramlibacter sp.]